MDRCLECYGTGTDMASAAKDWISTLSYELLFMSSGRLVQSSGQLLGCSRTSMVHVRGL
jgi:hypothetical protein